MDYARERLKVCEAKSINLQFKQERVKRTACAKIGRGENILTGKALSNSAACMLNDLCAPLGVAVGCNNS